MTDYLNGNGSVMHNQLPSDQKKRIALVAHDNRKQCLIEWAKFNRELLVQHELFATGTTGKLLAHELGTDVTRFKSGPLGGDQQLGAKIAEREIDLLIFFWDPLEPQPHDTDVKALLRVAVVWNIPMACNRASADFIISSPLMSTDYQPIIPNYASHTERLLAFDSTRYAGFLGDATTETIVADEHADEELQTVVYHSETFVNGVSVVYEPEPHVQE